MGEVKQIEIKNQTHYFYNDLIDLENFKSSLLNIEKMHYKGIDIYYIYSLYPQLLLDDALYEFGANKTPVEVIKKGAFGGKYFRDIYSCVTRKWYKNSWKEFDQLKDIDQNFYFSNYYDVSVSKYGVKCGTSLRLSENKG